MEKTSDFFADKNPHSSPVSNESEDRINNEPKENKVKPIYTKKNDIESMLSKNPATNEIASAVKSGLHNQSVSNQVSKETRSNEISVKTLNDLLVKYKNQLQMALPKHVTADRLIRVATTALAQNPKLGLCTQTSLLGCIVQSAQLGLEPNTPLGHAYLVPYYNGKKKVHEVQLITGYRGLVDLANRTGSMLDIVSNAVYSNDEFEYEYGTNHSLKHKPAKEDHGKLEAFYAYAHMKNQGFQFVVMSLQQVEAIRLRSKSGSDEHGNPAFIWKSDYVEMGKKTCIRKLTKMLPMSIEFAKAVEHDGTRPEPISLELDNLSETGEFKTEIEEVEADVL